MGFGRLRLVLGRGVLLLLLAGVAIACAPKKITTLTVGTSIPTYQAPTPEYCAPTRTITGASITVSGTATYQARVILGTPSTCNTGCGLGAASSFRPIRYAEVRVLSNSGQIVQCGETDASGNYSVTLPQGNQTYTLQVAARANNTQVKAAVYDDPRYNNLYAVSTSVNASSSQSGVDLNAPVTGQILGGAFNMYDQVLNANEYLRAQVGVGSGRCAGNPAFTSCPDFTVAPLVNIYWRPGFNPGTYFDTASGGVSFYLPGYSRIFILGGEGGNTDVSDTDHFDNSVIIHEYGHFLEDAFFGSDSPGGAHSGNRLIDPRLAWSEGWGNFFQAAVLGSPLYIDTSGNVDGPNGVLSTSFSFYVDLESQSGARARDIPLNAGEGNFREFSVTRLLWDAIDSNADSANGNTDSVLDTFPELWNALMSTTGWRRPAAAFRSIGWLHTAQQTVSGSANWSSIRGVERQSNSTVDYAQYVATGSTCNYLITPVDAGPTNNFPENGAIGNSNPLLNNDFYHLRLTTSQSVTLQLAYVDDDGSLAPSGVKADLDLYIYDEDHPAFGSGANWRASSVNTPGTSAATTEYETLNLGTLPAGNYLINVNAFTGLDSGRDYSQATRARYTLTLNGSQLCPASLP